MKLMPLYWVLAIICVASEASAQTTRPLQARVAVAGVHKVMGEIVDESSILRTAVSPMERFQKLDELRAQKDEKPLAVDSLAFNIAPGYWLEIVNADYSKETMLLIVSSTDGTPSTAIGVHLLTLDGKGIAIQNCYQTLPRVELPEKFTQGFASALRSTFVNCDFKAVDDFEVALSKEAGAVPAYISERLAGKSKTSLLKDNAVFNLASFDPHVAYVCSRSLTRTLSISVFTGKSSFGPYVFLVFGRECEKGIVVAATGMIVGEETILFANDIKAGAMKTERVK